MSSCWAGSATAVLTPDQPISRLLREDDSTYFPLFDFELVSSIRNVTTTAAGGFLVNAKTGVSFGDTYSINPPQANLAKDHIFGDVDGLTGAVLQVEDPAATINIGGTHYARVQYSPSIGYNASNGKLIYGADIDLMPDAPNKTNRLSAIFVGNTPAIVQGGALPSGNGFAGAVSKGVSFVSSSGDTAFYRGTYNNGVADVSGLFSTAGQVLAYNGMSLGPGGDTLFSLGNTSVSDNGAHYIMNPDVNQTLFEALVIDGQVAANPNGTYVREGAVAQTGGTAVFDPFDPFGHVAINNNGKWAAGTTLIDNGIRTEAMLINGQVAFSEGDVLPKLGGGNAAPLDGLAQYVDINNNGDVAFYFGSGTSAGAIVLNGVVVIENGDLIGADTIDKFGLAPVALSDRDANGIVHLYFNAHDTSGFDNNAFGLYHMSFNVGIPADLDGDGDVDDADFGIAFAAFTGPNNGPSSNPAADLDGDGDVDDADFGIAFAAFTGPGGSVNVPEPASALMCTFSLLACTRRRRV